MSVNIDVVSIEPFEKTNNVLHVLEIFDRT